MICSCAHHIVFHIMQTNSDYNLYYIFRIILFYYSVLSIFKENIYHYKKDRFEKIFIINKMKYFVF